MQGNEYLTAERRRDVRACFTRRGVAVQLDVVTGDRDFLKL
jgi:hypothetical protein